MSPSDSNLSLGEFLRQERERRGITLEQVASATKVGIRILHAIEADQYVELPAKPFIRGFVASYARFIGLESKEVLTQFGKFIEERSHDRPSRESGHSGYAFEKREGEQSRTVLWVVMSGFLVVGGVVFVFLKPSLHHSRGSHMDKLRSAHLNPMPSPSVAAMAVDVDEKLPSQMPSSAPVDPTEVPKATVVQASEEPAVPEKAVEKIVDKAAEPKSSEKPEHQAALVGAPTSLAPATGSPPSESSPAEESLSTESENDPLNSGLGLKRSEMKHKFVFRALGDVWVRYQVDGRKMMRFILRKDKILVLRAHEAIRFQVSEPKLIKFQYNGSAAKLLADDKAAVMRQGDLTLFAPAQLAESIDEPFPSAKTIYHNAVPQKAMPSPLSTPTD